jgi:uncharacterized repeat protein (TIGR03803 family)
MGAATPAFAQYTLTTLASFNGTNGDGPIGDLVLSGNTLYGTTQAGGANGDGEVFSVPVAGGTPTVMASFNSANGGANGWNPQAGLTLSGNTLYGTTIYGGANGQGEVFSEPLAGGTATVLGSFNGTDGENVRAGLTVSGNTLYGTAGDGGANFSDGEVFLLPVTGGTPNIAASFNGINGEDPQAGLTVSGSTLYGTTEFGGAYGSGEVFSVPVGGGTPKALASFGGTATGGFNPVADLTLVGSTLYGTAENGGANNAGVVFSVPVSGGTPTVLAAFNFTDGALPLAGLTLSGGTLYGTTYHGGATFGGGNNGDGEVFSLPVTGGTPTVLASFDGSDGEYPWADLTLSGNTLYGTTELGGAYGDGTVFSITIPEPTSLSVCAVGSIGLLKRRQRRRQVSV